MGEKNLLLTGEFAAAKKPQYLRVGGKVESAISVNSWLLPSLKTSYKMGKKRKIFAMT